MSPFALQVKKDFKTYWDAAEKGRLADQAKQRPLIVSAHKYAICFSTLSRAMSGADVHCRIFLQELASDSIHLVHALINGDARETLIYQARRSSLT
ncbi:hypothetical protein ACQCQP_22970 [Ralstonia pseudosolanacearum]|uniref:hypothetical protein n=1 Tax=Ralstonia pseudosolanacearum TaxID=1310165 RepID=UPI003CEA6F22